ncbi:Transposable element Tcb2 transposase [Brachionus plicatilis]|uniref:Transposable element Tcb2 transposase n=1 Tax=Brachionus plicatilis TaxID=10195 RepID=A0A3M7QS63_BRAPC|nr:Transposable element Tcb2 transposase [Brachionus plicatilis]
MDCVFIDQSLIELEVHTLKHRQKKGCRYNKAPVAKHSLKLLLWGGISFRVATPICIFNGKMQSSDFINILNRNLLPFIRRVFPDTHRLVMDNDPKHNSVLTQNWLKTNSIFYWPTPAQSPDLNPIELVWHELKTYIRHKKPQTKIQFINLIGKFWEEELTPEKCRRYILHIQRVMPHVLLNNGYETGF